MSHKLEAGQLLCNDKYQVKQLLGEGGFGTVWLAEEIASNTLVALKIIRDNPQAELRFSREVMLSRKLTHPDLLTANTVEQDGDLKILVLPYAPNGSLLKKLANKKPLPLSEVMNIAIALARALAYLHEEEDIVHRDIHPSNILFMADGNAKLTLGALVQMVEFSTSLWYGNSEGRHPGLAEYQPPEAFSRSNQPLKQLTPAADVYMAGAVIWEMLTGDLYYYNKGTTPKSINRGVPSALDHLVMDCLAEEPTGRPRNGTELLARLEQISTPKNAPPYLWLAGIISIMLILAGSIWIRTIGVNSLLLSPTDTPTPEPSIVEIGMTNIESVEIVPGLMKDTHMLRMNSMGLGSIEFTYPKEIALQESSQVRVNIIPNLEFANLPDGSITSPSLSTPVPIPPSLSSTKIYTTENGITIHIYPIMRAELRGTGFEIDPPQEDAGLTKFFDPPNPLIWDWIITPREDGVRTLNITFLMPVEVDGQWEVIRSNTLQTIPFEVLVRVTNTPSPTITPIPTNTPIPTSTPNVSQVARESLARGSTEILVAIIACFGALFVALIGLYKAGILKWPSNSMVAGQQNVDISRFTAKEALKEIESKKDTAILQQWLEAEEKGGKRSSVIEALKNKLKDHEDQ